MKLETDGGLLMRKFLAAATVVISLASLARVESQNRYVGPGSTVQGDILRGEGQYLRGAAWYELNAARAASINADAVMKIDAWNRQVYDAYKQERAEHLQRRANLTKAQEQAARRSYEEREARLRANPSSDEVIKGDALNALLLDLSNPSISPSSWRFAQIPLPDDLSIRSLVFRFAPKAGSKSDPGLSRCVIALARLDTIKGNRWGTVLSLNPLAPERRAYDEAYSKVRDECLAGNLSLESPLQLKKALLALKDKVGKSVPAENGYRAAAEKGVDDLLDAAKIFHADTIDYAREMIADTQQHDAKTVGELLAFMRKYRLLFSNAEKVPSGGEAYARLYRLLREQKEKLGLMDGVVPDNLGNRAAKLPDERAVGRKDQDPDLIKAALLGKIETGLRFATMMRFDKFPECRESRAKAVKALNAAIKDANAGASPEANIRKALESLEELAKIITTSGHKTNTSASIKAVKEALELLR